MDDIKYGLAWSDDYKLGNPTVDEQHHRLFELVSEIVVACTEDRGTETLARTLDFLLEYTVKHFRDEEAIQIQFGFPDLGRHKLLHEDFKREVSELVQDFRQSGSSEELSNNVNRVIVRWLINHIQREDKKIVAHIRSIRGV